MASNRAHYERRGVAMHKVCLCAGAPYRRPELRDLEPDVTRLWRVADTLSLQEPRDLSLHTAALIEARDKLDQAISLSKQEEVQ